MTITSTNDIRAGLSAGRSYAAKASGLVGVYGPFYSLWTTSSPAGAIPTATAACSSTTPGATYILPSRLAGQNRIIAGAELLSSGGAAVLGLEDRLAHMGGLNGTLTTAQAVNLDLDALAGTSNLAQRKGLADFSEVEWYLEWYTATGATVVNPAASVTFTDNTTALAPIFNAGTNSLPASTGVGRRYRIVPNVAKYIKSVQSVTLGSSTGVVGNFGVTAIRRLCSFSVLGASATSVSKVDWTSSYAVEVFDQSCIGLSGYCPTTGAFGMTGSILWSVK